MTLTPRYPWLFPAALCLLAATSARVQAADDGNEPDNGTDPTRTRSSAALAFERVEPRSDAGPRDTLRFTYGAPIAPRTTLILTVPAMVSADGPSGRHSGPGDIGLKLSHIAALGREGGTVVQGEVVFDSAHNAPPGNGATVVKATVVRAFFLAGGAIFAPSATQSLGLDDGPSGERASSMVLDFYYVPRLANRNLVMTLDPAISFDWRSGGRFGSLSIMVGHVLGPMWGGRAQVYVKPTAFMGGQRPSSWAAEAGIKLLGF